MNNAESGRNGMEQQMERAGNFLPRVDDAAGSPNAVDRRVVSLTAPASGAAEQYRSLYYRLERMRELRPMKVIAFTSAMPGEGKTVSAVNLALAAARPDRVSGLLICFLLALGVGVLTGVVMEMRDDTIRDTQELRERLPLPVLAVVPNMQGKVEKRVLMPATGNRNGVVTSSSSDSPLN